MKQVADVRYGLGQPPPARPDGIPILRATNIERGRINPEGMIYAALPDLPLHRAPLLKSGEVLVVRSGAYTGDSALITPEWEGSAPGYDLRLTPRSIDSRFLAYQLLGTRAQDQIALAKMRAAQPHLNADDLGDVEVMSSTPDQERSIADYLDAETTRIDALVAARRRQLDLMNERVASTIWKGATKGLRRSKGRPSGLDWVGDMPDQWGLPPIGASFEVQLGKMLNPDATGAGEQNPYLRNVNVQWDRIDLDDLNEMHFDAQDRMRYALVPGDLIVCEGGEVGRAALWDGSRGDCYYQKALHRVRARRDVNVRFLMYALWAAASRGVFDNEGNTSTIVHLTAEKLRVHRFPWPPRIEQDEIVRELDRVRGDFERTKGAFERQVGLLLERRQALITAAVTGQLTVPGAAA